jgi:superfamily II DNA/RNA helicase
MGRSGQAITIIAATDLTKMQEIERHLGRKLPRVTVAQLAAQAPVAPMPRAIELEVAPVQPAAVVGLEVRKRRRRRRPIEASAQSAVI